jgi:hypothetical protein
MIDLLIYLLVLCLIFGLIFWVIRQLPLPAPFASIAIAVTGVICIIILLSMLVGGPPFRLAR